MLPINPIAADHEMTTIRCLLRSSVVQKGNPKAQTIPINAASNSSSEET